MEVHGSDQRLKTFFNASYISSLVKSTQQKGPSFIASSSPQYNGAITKNSLGELQPCASTSIANFWQMVWDSNTKMIVMLCPLVGKDKEESNAYWESQFQSLHHLVVVEEKGVSIPVDGVHHRILLLKRRNPNGNDTEFIEER